ncbi:Zinc finger domain-containing protein [Giardia lamblia P15]|uniref:Zinc finger domain-containing protein n=1 Tax=Giardia intestinalis (strain P15) TaxID=658858 RepID=E1F3T2_GIAIA|nr:Zinc finger domain-containing protein [Giardia lamblia P15]
MEPCSACQQPARYRCPSCQLMTCSLACFAIHKEVTGCCGKADPPTAYIPLAEYDENAFYRDIAFLQRKIIHAPEARASDDVMDPPFALWTSGRQSFATLRTRYKEYIDLPYFTEAQRTIMQACLQRETFLCIAPPASARRRYIPSYDPRTDLLSWPLRIRLVNSETSLLIDRMLSAIPETDTVQEILEASLSSPSSILGSPDNPAIFLEDERLPSEAIRPTELLRVPLRIPPSCHSTPLKKLFAHHFIMQYPVFTILT